MDPFKCYTYEEAIGHETGITRIQPQGYYRLIENLQRVGKLISNINLELKRVLGQTAHVSELPQGCKPSLKIVLIHCAE